MPFPEPLKLTIRQRAHFRCCLCRTIGVEIHHIIPQEENGPDTEENAAPLCPSCHEIYGANPTKRKFIREARDFWYETCTKTYESSGLTLTHLNEALTSVATRNDIERISDQLSRLIQASQAQDDFSTKEDFKPVPLERFIRSLYEEDFGENPSSYDLLFDSRLWHERDRDSYEMLDLRADFLKAYGEETAKRICLVSCKETGFNPKGFTEVVFARTLKLVQTTVILIMGHTKFNTSGPAFECALLHDGDFLWAAANESSRASKVRKRARKR